MCWQTNKSKYAKIHIAKRNIKVVKIVNTSKFDKYYIESSIYRFNYKLNVLYKLNQEIILTRPDGLYIINRGFHSYSPKCKIDISSCKFITQYYTCKLTYNNYVHYINTSLDYSAIMYCIIPKDAKYYFNDHGEYVSDMIKPISIIPLNEAIKIVK